MIPDCKASAAGTALTPEELSWPGPPDRRSFTPCPDYNYNQEGCQLAAVGQAHGPKDNPLLHICSFLMTDGYACSRNHKHINHGSEMVRL